MEEGAWQQTGAGKTPHIMCCVSAFESSNQNLVFYQFFLST